MVSPFFYIVFSLTLTSAVLSLAFFMAWKNFGRKPHALTWSAAFLAGTLQWLCVMNADAFPSSQIFLLAENGFSTVLVTLGLRGHCQRTHCKRLPKNLWPYALAIYSVIVWAILIEPNVGLRMATVPAYAAITLIMSARMIVRYRERTRPAEWAAAISIFIFAIIQAIDSVLALMQGPAGEESIAAAYLHFNFLTLPAGYTGMSMLVMMMMASDISAKMKKMATSDHLTGLLNRRGFNEYGERAFAAARRAGTDLSVIMTDIDRFKFINDKYGHAAGDSALAHFARTFAEARRKEDVVARVGGEEFALLLPGTNLRDAMAIADQLCSKIGSTPMDMTSIGLPMTSSFGVAAISEKDVTLDEMVLRADRAMYRSKRAGRNQVDLESSQLMLALDGTLKPVTSG
jgi:diguanylate cyclase (GGDEF)-like protein